MTTIKVDDWEYHLIRALRTMRKSLRRRGGTGVLYVKYHTSRERESIAIERLSPRGGSGYGTERRKKLAS